MNYLRIALAAPIGYALGTALTVNPLVGAIGFGAWIIFILID